MQEVQTTLNWYEIPNRIEWIWISERKIKEHYQVTPTFTFECEASWSASLHASSGSPEVQPFKWAFTLSSQSWPTEFSIVDGWIRIPIAWWYLAEMTLSGWSSNFEVTVSIKVWNNVLYTWSFRNNSSSTSTVLNLWKFDLVEIRLSWHYYWSSAWANASWSATIKLKKL